MQSTNTIIDLIIKSVKNENFDINVLTEIFRLNGLRVQKIGNSGRPTKIARDIAITTAYMWRRKFFNEKAEQATEWILSNWSDDGLSDPSHVRAKIKAVKDRYRFSLIVNICYDGAVVDLGLDVAPSDKVPFPKESPIVKFQNEDKVIFLFRAIPKDREDSTVFLWWPDFKEAIIEETLEVDPNVFDFLDSDAEKIDSFIVDDNKTNQFVNEFTGNSYDEVVRFFKTNSNKFNGQ